MNDHKNLFVGIAVTLGVLVAVGIPVIYFITKKAPVVPEPQDTSAIFGIAPTSSSTASSTRTLGGDSDETDILGAGPVVTFTINNQVITPGSSATLSWSAEGASLCSAGGAQDAWFFTGNATSGSAQTSPITNDKTFTLVCADDTGATTVRNVVAMIPRATGGDTEGSSGGFVKDIFSTISWTSKKVTQPIFSFFDAEEGKYSTIEGTTTSGTTTNSTLGLEKADLTKLVPKENSEDIVITPVKTTINSGRQGTIRISASRMASCKTGSEIAWGENRLKGIPTSGEVKTGNLSNKTPGATSARSYPLSVVCVDPEGVKAVSSTSILVRPALQYTISFPTPDNTTLIPKWNESIDETAVGSYRLAYKHIARSQVPDVKIKALNASSCTLERPNNGGTVSDFPSNDGGVASGNTPVTATSTVYEVHCLGTDERADPSEPSFDNPKPYSITYTVHDLANIPAMTGNPGESCKEMLDRAGYTIIAGTQMQEYIYGKNFSIRSDISPISIWSQNCYYSDGQAHKMDYGHPDLAPYIPTMYNPSGSRVPTLEKVYGTALTIWTGGLLGGGTTFGGLFGGSDQPRPITWSGYFHPHPPTP